MEKYPLDRIDRRIIAELQRDATLSISHLAEIVGLSPTPCWKRIKKLEDAGIILKRVTLIDQSKVDLGVTVFIFIRTSQHTGEWYSKFTENVALIPEVMELYRVSGSVDYLIKAVVSSIEGYDALYKRLVNVCEISDTSASFVMEVIKSTTELPIALK